MTELYMLGLLLLAWLVACALSNWRSKRKTGAFDTVDRLMPVYDDHETHVRPHQEIEAGMRPAYDPHTDEHKQMLGEVESYFD